MIPLTFRVHLNNKFIETDHVLNNKHSDWTLDIIHPFYAHGAKTDGSSPREAR
jgi:hypothetical protein